MQQSPRASIDYPELATTTVLRPPPAAASGALERQDNRPRQAPYSPNNGALVAPKTPRIGSDYPVTYWLDIQIGTSGLKNLGNTCYMNAPIQCLSATVPFARFFTGEFLFAGMLTAETLLAIQTGDGRVPSTIRMLWVPKANLRELLRSWSMICGVAIFHISHPWTSEYELFWDFSLTQSPTENNLSAQVAVYWVRPA